MKRIGVLSLVFDNYGTRLQSYALFKILKGIVEDDEIEFINVENTWNPRNDRLVYIKLLLKKTKAYGIIGLYKCFELLRWLVESKLLRKQVDLQKLNAQRHALFNHIISLIDEFKYLEDITYIWKYNYKSITRRNNYEYTFNSLDGYIYNICYSIEEALKKNANIEKVSKLIIGTMYEMYFNYLKYIKYEKVNNIFIWSKKIKELFLIYNTKISNYDKKKVVEEEFYKRIGNLDIIDYLNNRITFDDFLNSIDCENISNEIII